MKGRKLKVWMSILVSLCMVFSSLTSYAQEVALGDTTASLDAMETLKFTEYSGDFVNPERGWHRIFTSDKVSGFDKLKAQGINIVLLEADLQNFKNGPISSSKLEEVNNGFAEARKNGLKVIFRAAYDYTGITSCEPKDINIILNHIAQFKDIFYKNEDVLFCVDSGFLGPWGEWHSSYYGNGDTPSLDARKKVLFAMLDAVPKSRMVEIRRPMFIRDIYKNEPGGNVLTEATAFSGSNLARTGFHNDAVLTTDSDYGTYVEPGYDRQAELNWTDNHNKYTIFGGESATITKNSDPDNAVYELNKLHAQYLNIDYYPDVITKWKNTIYNNENTFTYISKRLGYRFILTEAQISKKVSPGKVLHLTLKIKNDGFSVPMNQRNFEVVLKNGTKTYKTKVNDDIRRWTKDKGIMTKDLYFTVPSDIAAGNWNVYVNFPDFADSLKDRPDYSIRLANNDVWEASTGYNLVKSGLIVENSGTANTSTTFAQISRADAEKIMNVAVNANAPIISNVSATDITSNGSVINWKTDKDTTSVIEYGTSTSLGSKMQDTSLSQSHTIKLTSLKSDSTYYYKIISKDKDNLEATSTVYSFKTLPEEKTEVPEEPKNEAWDSVPALAQASSGNVRSLKAKNDESMLYLMVSGSNLNNKSQFYLNTDNNTATGYNACWSKSGCDYLVENNSLYKYSGTNGSWNWTKVCDIKLTKGNALIEAALPLNKMTINSSNTVQIGFISNDNWENTLPKQNTTLPKYELASMKVPVTSITLSKADLSLDNGTNAMLSATINPSNATNQGITYSSSDTTIVTVDSSGKVTAIKPGKAVVTVTSVDNGVKAICNITVNANAPIISNVSATDITSNGSVINWKTDKDTTSVIEYGTSTSLGSKMQDTSLSQSHTIKLTSLKSDSTYYYKIISKDKDNLEATSTVYSFKTLPEEKPEVPTEPKNEGWDDISALAQSSSGNVSSLKAKNDESTLYIMVSGSGLDTKSQFYLNTDNNASTGYNACWNKSGCDYLIENNILYKYSGTKGSWNWTKVCTITLTKESGQIEVALPLNRMTINSSGIVQIGFISNDNWENILPRQNATLPKYVLSY